MNRTKLVIPVLTLTVLASAGVTWAVGGATAAGTLPKNVTTACDHGNRLYSGKSGSALAVVPRDPTCPQPTTKKPTAPATTTTRPAATTSKPSPPSTTRTQPPVATAPATSTTPPGDGDGGGNRG